MIQRDSVFLSYARPDEASVKVVFDRLSAVGINAWMDKMSILPGAEWESAIANALRTARLVLVFLSANSVTREGFLQKEIVSAVEIWKEKAPGQIYLIPVRLEECAIHERLSRFHWINLYEPDGWTRLLAHVTKVLLPADAFRSDMVASHAASGASIDTPRPPLHVGGSAIPAVTFPEEVRRFMLDSLPPGAWDALDLEVQRFVLTLGCKLEPIVQIVPATPVPLVHGFECLGLGALGENFFEICRRCKDIDPGLIRVCLALVAIKTIATFRAEAARAGQKGARNLVFSMNLDPFMIESPHFKKLLNWYYMELLHNVVFEVNETTTKQYLDRLKKLQVDYTLRYSADDLNNWHPEVRAALIDRVEMTKMDYKSFIGAMELRGDNRDETIKRLLAHNQRDKPLIVEGVEDPDYLEFLQRNWDARKWGALYGQGYVLDSGIVWDRSVKPLKLHGLPGGSFFPKVAA